jgi:hypothetical protein
MSNGIINFQEVSSCYYELTVGSTQLCKIPAFRWIYRLQIETLGGRSIHFKGQTCVIITVWKISERLGPLVTPRHARSSNFSGHGPSRWSKCSMNLVIYLGHQEKSGFGHSRVFSSLLLMSSVDSSKLLTSLNTFATGNDRARHSWDVKLYFSAIEY